MTRNNATLLDVAVCQQYIQRDLRQRLSLQPLPEVTQVYVCGPKVAEINYVGYFSNANSLKIVNSYLRAKGGKDFTI